MSTFDGIIAEFPDIRIDHFRNLVRPCGVRACFLSHVHSDHLAGLESYNGPFIYCSAATREMLLRLEKYSNRMNFASGILEQRKATYTHLKSRLKPVPLETPTYIELEPNRKIRATLFDANHCPGAVMFLIEDDSKAILYTGDIRSEVWWVNTLLRHPILLPYVTSMDQEPLKRLDNMYLDTTFANTSEHYEQFPSKASGTRELLRKVSQYPKDAVFYFDTWTFGYEEVWQSLSSFLQSPIHVDQYRYNMYSALARSEYAEKASEAFKLIGAKVGNHFQQGCLSTQAQRIHSCEKGTGCDIWNKNFIRITPIVTRHKGVEHCEVGAGGGYGDLNQQHELEIDNSVIIDFLDLCGSKLPDQPQIMSEIREILRVALQTPPMSLKLDVADMTAGVEATVIKRGQGDGDDGVEPILVEHVVDILANHLSSAQKTKPINTSETLNGLPRRITFPYSRHSSYSELCELVASFKPKDIHPCTVDSVNWTTQRSMSYLFGHMYDPSQRFSHDQKMLRELKEKQLQVFQLSSRATSQEEVGSQNWEEARLASDLRRSGSSNSRSCLASIDGRRRRPNALREDETTAAKVPSSVGVQMQSSTLSSLKQSKPKKLQDTGRRVEESLKDWTFLPQWHDHFKTMNRQKNESLSDARASSGSHANQPALGKSKRLKRKQSLDATGVRARSPDEHDLSRNRKNSAHRGGLRPSELGQQKVDYYSIPRKARCSSEASSDGRLRRSCQTTSALETPLGEAEVVMLDSRVFQQIRSQPSLLDNPYTRNGRNNNGQRQIAPARQISSLNRQESQPGPGPLQTEQYRRLSSDWQPEGDADMHSDEVILLDGIALRNALRKEVYDSVLGVGLNWADIGLVTVTGHEKEEEL